MSFVASSEPLSGSNVTINPVDTVWLGPLEVKADELIFGHILNTDGSQGFNGRFQSSPDQVNWVDVQTLEAVAAGGLRPFQYGCAGERWVRGIGTATGAGLTLTRWARTGHMGRGGGGR